MAGYRSWRTCGQHKVFDRYSVEGLPSDGAACRAALLDQCGENLDAALAGGKASAGQRAFADCCAAASIDGAACPMIDPGFSRGPCHDREVCVDRSTGDWLRCTALPGAGR